MSHKTTSVLSLAFFSFLGGAAMFPAIVIAVIEQSLGNPYAKALLFVALLNLATAVYSTSKLLDREETKE